ncbi:hypothetical protein RYA07_15625 [Pseudomonas syringae pv. actinidiae]|uniref:hypothetical protein n=1 Tax=Pseudomonas syringae TaxID=317 RepID=UPI0002095929|nr:hypothetical protein [Pseudomonas syringae]MDU8489829.1 hypothetical protein [Pseudomonas syringae pv. actinidiae]EGH68052.1 hypothetical protein PSYAC_24738 [Pseudomonas syringae pv. actinidiae str. M302091]EPM46982.1 hypothetical protein A256_23299 [Pseudomonas syringae pv. actinidiae ICMP 19103]EPN00795.1 hypothetical protein A253_23279 [Pseudomonas syringae pv. actinidiae ICMP 19102]NVL32496.1 hypothetical protein [Pseudomonas syringae pv. actinidiae]
MSWTNIKFRWPAQATQWMGQMAGARNLIQGEMLSTGERVSKLADIATTSPGPIGGAAQVAISAGRTALAEQFENVPSCIVVTPFQHGVGQGSGGHQRFLSAPNLLQLLADKLTDTTDAVRPQGQQSALVLIFLATRLDQLAATLGRFNVVLPMPDLVRAERRAEHLAKLEVEKWIMPIAGQMPLWSQLPLQRCPITKLASQSMAGQLAVLEGYAADSSPMADLADLQARKKAQVQEREQQLADLKAQFTNSAENVSIQARMLGPGDLGQLRRELLEGEAPGHEWPLCAGVLLVGSAESLSFVQELVGL